MADGGLASTQPVLGDVRTAARLVGHSHSVGEQVTLGSQPQRGSVGSRGVGVVVASARVESVGRARGPGGVRVRRSTEALAASLPPLICASSSGSANSPAAARRDWGSGGPVSDASCRGARPWDCSRAYGDARVLQRVALWAMRCGIRGFAAMLYPLAMQGLGGGAVGAGVGADTPRRSWRRAEWSPRVPPGAGKNSAPSRSSGPVPDPCCSRGRVPSTEPRSCGLRQSREEGCRSQRKLGVPTASSWISSVRRDRAGAQRSPYAVQSHFGSSHFGTVAASASVALS